MDFTVAVGAEEHTLVQLQSKSLVPCPAVRDVEVLGPVVDVVHVEGGRTLVVAAANALAAKISDSLLLEVSSPYSCPQTAVERIHAEAD